VKERKGVKEAPRGFCEHHHSGPSFIPSFLPSFLPSF
jgi:hypothetical protein